MKNLCKHLFESVKIGRVEIKNRIALAPMGTGSILVDSEGKLGPRGVEYYLERCRGGVGLIISHASKVENEIDPLKIRQLETLSGPSRRELLHKIIEAEKSNQIFI